MSTLIVVLLVAIFLMLGAGLFLMYGQNVIGKKAPKEDSAPLSSSSIVTVRNAPSKSFTIQVNFEDDSASAAVPYYSDIEYDEYGEKTMLERFMDPDTPKEEKDAIEEELRLHYNIRRGSKSPDRSLPAESGDEPAVNDFSDIDDIEVLLEKFNNPYCDYETKEAIARRVDELREKAAGEGEGERDGGDDGDGGEGGGGAPSGEEPVSGFVDPLSMISPPEQEERSDEPEVPVQEVLADDFGEGADWPLEGAVSEVFEPLPGDIPDDDADSRKAVELMTFIAKSLKDGLISQELASFAQNKLNLNVSDSVWNGCDRTAYSKEREDLVFDECSDMSLDQFDMKVRSDVRKSSAERKAESAVSVSEGSGKQAVVKPAASRGRLGSVTVVFGNGNGKDDLMWKRVEPASS